MKRAAQIIVVAIALIAATGFAAREARAVGRYVSCENHAGAGFFWVDTMTGKTWWSDMSGKDKIGWKYYGQPQGAKVGAAGTYAPQPNKSGGGLFILNTTTGEGWWTNGQEWKPLGEPAE